MNEITKAEAKAGACAYILHMLLQRLEATQPGMVEGLLNGAKADQASFNAQSSTQQSSMAQIFAESIAMLDLIHAQNQIAPRPQQPQ